MEQSTIKYKEQNPILRYSKELGISKTALHKALNVTLVTLNTWIERPHLMTIDKLTTMAGMFGMSPVELLHLLLLNRANLKDQDKWFISKIIDKHSEF